MFLWIVLTLVIAFLLWWLYRTRKPLVYYNKEGEIAPIVDKLQEIKKPYSPTPWLINRHIHTVYGMQYRPGSKMKPERQMITFEDGGIAALDWFKPKEVKPRCPVAIVIHTLGGGTREPCISNLCEAFTKHGIMAVVVNSRGCSGVPFKTRRMYNGLQIDDLDAAVKLIRKEKDPEDIYMVGFSMGAYMTAHYCATIGGITAGACCSHTYNGKEANKPFCSGFSGKFYQPFLMSKLKHQAFKNPFIDEETRKKIPELKTLVEFDRLLTIPLLGVKTPEEYYDQIRACDKIPITKVPIMFIGSDDDPFTSKHLMPIKEVLESQKCVFIETREGGHVSFIEGFARRHTLCERLVPEWFEKVTEYYHKNK